MRCQKAHRLVSRRLDRRLPPLDEATLDAHLVACGSCRRAAARLEGAWSALGAAGAPAAPDDFARIAARAEEPPRAPLLAFIAAAFRAPAQAASVASFAAIGIAAGLALSRAAPTAPPAAAVEASALLDGFADLPFASPATPVAAALRRSPEEVRR